MRRRCTGYLEEALRDHLATRVHLRVIDMADLDLLDLIASDVQNLYDRANVGGLDIEVDEDELVIEPEPWPGYFASAGIALEL